MIICDECRNVGAKAFDCTLILEKDEESTRKAERLQKNIPKRTRRREVVRIPVSLCDDCITKMCRSLGKMKAYGTMSRWEDAPPPAPPTDLRDQ